MSHKSFISEKQVTQFIVNSYDFKTKEVHKLGFGGGSSLYLLREKPEVPFNVYYLFRDCSNGTTKRIFLGYYSSEELETYPNFFYPFPSGEVVDYHDVCLAKNFLSSYDSYRKIIDAIYNCGIKKPAWKDLMNYIREKNTISFSSTKDVIKVAQKPIIKAQEKPINIEEKSTKIETKKPDRKKMLETKLRLIDLQIEREKILQELDNL